MFSCKGVYPWNGMGCSDLSPYLSLGLVKEALQRFSLYLDQLAIKLVI